MGAPVDIIAESFLVKVAPKPREGPTSHSGDADEEVFAQVTCSLIPISASKPANGQDYTLVPIEVIITTALPAALVSRPAAQSEVIKNLVNIILSSSSATVETPWFGRIFLVVPNRSGFIGRTKCFQQRLIGCADLGLVHDRTSFAQIIHPVPIDDIEKLFSNYLLAIVRHDSAVLCDETTLVQEIHARLNFQWCFDQRQEHKTTAVVDGKLSARGDHWSKVGYNHGKQDAYDPVQNPNGVVSLDNAQNWFLHDDLTAFINSHNHFDKENCSYGEGYTGTLRLRTAMSNHLNEYFAPVVSFDPEEITFAAGVTGLNEICAMVLCDPGDAIMLGRPSYSSFNKDFCLRTGVKIEWASFRGDYQFSLLAIADYEAAFEEAKARGINIKALVICNPHNPLGQCYPPDTLKALMEFCASKEIHLVSDEIYALSTYERDDRSSEKFTSVRAINYSGIIDPRQVHVLYGMSKDYGAAGMRLGCVISQNPDFSKAVRAVCRFSSPSQYSMNLAAKFLENRQFVHELLQKSRRMLLQSRLYAEELLKQTDILYHDEGNAGLAIWLDLRGYIPSLGANFDPWFAERLISKRFEEAGVLIDAGGRYGATTAGRFRLVFTVDSETLREGIKRINYVLQHF